MCVYKCRYACTHTHTQAGVDEPTVLGHVTTLTFKGTLNPPAFEEENV